MGLDIYFEKRKTDNERLEAYNRVCKEIYEFYKKERTDEELESQYIDNLEKTADELDPRTRIVCFRKVNFLIPYFDYYDNVEYKEISKCEIEELINVANTILATKVGEGENVTIDKELAEELLPTQCGFFFGSTEYDALYIADLEYVVEQMTQVLNNVDWETETLEMYCSW